MQLKIGLSGIVTILLIAGSAGGCTRASPSDPSYAPNSSVTPSNHADDADTIYDPTVLTEKKQFADLPEEVRAMANNSFMKDRFDNTPTKFLVGGSGGSSAIVAYEEGGYVPSYHARAYVYNHSHWVRSKDWLLPSEIITLRDLIAVTATEQEMAPR